MAAQWQAASLNEIKEESDKKKLQKVISALEIVYVGASERLYFFINPNETCFSVVKRQFSLTKLIYETMRFREKYKIRTLLPYPRT